MSRFASAYSLKLIMAGYIFWFISEAKDTASTATLSAACFMLENALFAEARPLFIELNGNLLKYIDMWFICL